MFTICKLILFTQVSSWLINYKLLYLLFMHQILSDKSTEKSETYPTKEAHEIV